MTFFVFAATLDMLLRCTELHREALHAAICKSERAGAPKHVIAAALCGEPLNKLGCPAHLSVDDLLSALSLIAVYAAVPDLVSELEFIGDTVPSQLLYQSHLAFAVLQVRTPSCWGCALCAVGRVATLCIGCREL